MQIFNNKKLRPLFIIVGVVLLVAAVFYAIYINTMNPYGDSLDISNLDEYTAGKPTNDDRVNLIKHNLYDAVQFNSKDKIANNSIKDIVIREGSFSQDYDDSIKVYTVNFIVDIESKKQSYKVSYQWTDIPEAKEYVDEYGTQVTCLPVDELKYGDFKCVDERIEEMGVENYDPIQPLLPYHKPGKYKITDYDKDIEEKTITLEVEAYTPAQMYRLDQATLDSYTKDIQEWLKSRKLDPTKYDIYYIY